MQKPRTIIESEVKEVSRPFDGVESVTRLALMLGLESADQLIALLRQAEAELPSAPTPSEESAEDRLRYLLLGLLFMGQRNVRHLAAFAWKQVSQVAQMTEKWLKPFGELWVVQVLDNVTANWLRGAINEGRKQELLGRVLVQKMTGHSIDEIVNYVATTPQTTKLVNRQIEQLLDNQHVERLSADILDNLAQNPEPVTRLLQKQSHGFVNELREQIRERSVSLDLLADRAMSRLLRRINSR